MGKSKFQDFLVPNYMPFRIPMKYVNVTAKSPCLGEFIKDRDLINENLSSTHVKEILTPWAHASRNQPYREKHYECQSPLEQYVLRFMSLLFLEFSNSHA